MARPLPQLDHRGAIANPANRFETLHFERDPGLPPDALPPTTYLKDASKSILSSNTSPDIPFNYSVNPYRGCSHGCPYCYARPTHEYLGMSAGLDFESRVLVKLNAAELLREELSRPKWTGEVVALSGVTDPYQPIERQLEITRACLEVLVERQNPVSIITKNRLVTRDKTLLSRLADLGKCVVCITLTSLDNHLSAMLEPRASAPAQRLSAIQELAAAGVHVSVSLSPLIPAINDREVPQLLTEAKRAGAKSAGCIPLRLPGAVAGLFEDWLRRYMPDRAEHVLSLVRQMRRGKLNESQFGERMQGKGEYAEQQMEIFELWRRKLGFHDRPKLLQTCKPRPAMAKPKGRKSNDKEQLKLFDGA